ncbi:MAG: DmsC/YnfH family molybdoenzyme membrane anchor subunit [Bacillota bacterium]
MGAWSLVIFSVCLQAAIGLFIWAIVIKSRKPDLSHRGPAFWATILSGVAMLASLGHLGVPLKAVNSITQIGSSWLSREIIFAASFFVIALVSYVLERVNPMMTKGFYWIGGVVGLAGVFSMSKIYMNTVIPAWATWYTMVDFFATALILGGILFLVLVKADRELAAEVSISVLTFALIYAALTPLYLAALGAGGGAASASAALMAGEMQVLLLAKWLLILGGVLLTVVPLRKEGRPRAYMTASLVTLSVGALVGRYLFYAAGVAKAIGLI